MLCKRTFAGLRRGSHQNGRIRANKFRFAFSLSASTRAGLASLAIPDKVNEPIAVAAQSGDGGFSPLRAPVMAIDVASWLQQLGLDQYEPAFRDNDVDGEILPDLTAEDLIAIGVTSVGHRRKFLSAIA